MFSQSSSSYQKLADLIHTTFGTPIDSALLEETIRDCHRAAQETIGTPAREEELIHFAQAKVRILSRSHNIRNHFAVLRKALPECFRGPAFHAFRRGLPPVQGALEASDVTVSPEAEQEQKETEERLERWSRISERHRGADGRYDLQAIANDEELDLRGRELVRIQIQKWGRLAPSGL